MSPIGITITTTETPQPVGAGTSTGTAFIAGIADKGPLTPKKCLSLSDYITTFGPRTTASATLYDSVETYFRENGVQAYVARVSDNTAVAAALTLNDGLASPKPTVVVTAATPGTDGNNTYAHVTTATAATFTGNTTSASPTVANVSSFANLGVGVPVTGTGIPANTYVQAINTGASTLTLNANATATATAVVITPSNYTVLIEDSNANVLETHGPYITTAQLYADTTSLLVVFSQSAGSGFTTNQPAAAAAAPLTGGLDANDITDASYVTTINTQFTSDLGPGQVLIPGRNTTTIWAGLAAHAAANNRVALLDLGASGSAASFVSALGTAIGAGANGSYTIPIAGYATIPGLAGTGTTRTVPASAVAAALCSQVAATNNDNQWPCGRSWPLQYVSGFTAAHSATALSGVTTVFTKADVNTLNAAGINSFAYRQGVLCLWGFVTAVPQSTDLIYWSGSASRERMALVDQAKIIADPYLFDTLDGQGNTITAFHGDLQALISRHWQSGALFGATALDAGSVNTASPVNTPTTEAGGALNAVLDVRISPVAGTVSIVIAATPVTQSVVA